ncbi:MAG: glycosyltransferase [Micromonosporaceae bacterium]|nr:glycosyltransferase [Micromonosporaceae bacterium]
MGWAGRVVQVLATSTGGVGSHVVDLTRGLVTAGAEVTVCGPAATEARFDFTGAGARFVPVEISTGTQPSDARAVGALRRAITAAGADVVHAHGLRAGLVASFVRGGGRLRPARPPLVVTLHNAVLGRGMRGGASRVVERIVARTADVLLGASSDLVARAVAVGAADARLAPVAAPQLAPPARTSAAVRAELRVPAGAPLVLSVGRLHPQKGYDVLVAAAARWRDRVPVPRVVIAGNGPSYLDLTARISATRAPVTLLGHRSDVADLLLAADLAVVSSVWEARQLFAQEALRAGVPLVASAVGGIPELVGDAAVLVPPGDVDALDQAVRGLLDDPARLARYGRRGRAEAAGWPTSAQTLAQVQQVYAELGRLAAGGGPARTSAADP